MKKRLKRVLVVLPVILAVAVVVILVRTRSGPEKKTEGEVGRPLRAIRAPVVDLRPRSVGYGLAEPGRVWRAVAQVKGEAVSVHPKLQAGELVNEGSELLRINPADYELAVARLKANIAQTQAKLDELTAEKKTSKGLCKSKNGPWNLQGNRWNGFESCLRVTPCRRTRWTAKSAVCCSRNRRSRNLRMRSI